MTMLLTLLIGLALRFHWPEPVKETNAPAKKPEPELSGLRDDEGRSTTNSETK